MLILSIIFLILSNSLSLRRDISIYYSRIGMLIQLFCINIGNNSFYINYLDKGLSLYGDLMNISCLALIFHLFIFLLSFLILNITGFYPRKYQSKYYQSLSNLINKKRIISSNLINKKGEQYTIIEYTLIINFILIGSMLLISSGDLISLYLSIELQSYGLYILCTMYRNSESSTGSGLTYFLLGGLSSCFILLGIGLIYANTGTMNLDSFYIITNITNNLSDNEINNTMTIDIGSYLPYCLLLITIGYLFKMSAAPLHFWSPDVYDGIPTLVTTFVAIIPKISILVILFQIVHFTNNINITSEYTWTSSLLISSILSLIIGTVLGLTQIRIKRLFAYSTISHLGFILLGLSINTVESVQSFIFYLIQYSISNLNAFIILISIGYTLFFFINKNISSNNLIDKNNSPIQLISQIKGYFYINHTLTISLAITLFSFAGIPPLIGFFGKLMVLSAAMQKGFVFLALIAVITSVISAVYYLNVVKSMFFEEQPYSRETLYQELSAQKIDKNKVVESKYINSNVYLSNAFSIPVSILTLIIVLFMISPDQILHMSKLLSIIIFTSSNVY